MKKQSTQLALRGCLHTFCSLIRLNLQQARLSWISCLTAVTTRLFSCSYGSGLSFCKYLTVCSFNKALCRKLLFKQIFICFGISPSEREAMFLSVRVCRLSAPKCSVRVTHDNRTDAHSAPSCIWAIDALPLLFYCIVDYSVKPLIRIYIFTNKPDIDNHAHFTLYLSVSGESCYV